MKTSIITERLLIDFLSTGDEDFMLELVNTKGWLKFIGDRNIHSKEDAAAYIKKILSNSNIIYYVVRVKENKFPAGIISFIKRFNLFPVIAIRFGIYKKKPHLAFKFLLQRIVLWERVNTRAAPGGPKIKYQ